MAAVTTLTEDFGGGALGSPILLTNTIFDSETGLGADSQFATLGGLAAMRSAPGATDNRLYRADYAASATMWFGGYFDIPISAVTNTAIITVYSGTTKIADVQMQPDSTMRLRSVNTERWASIPLATGTRHRFALQVFPNAAGTGTLRLRLYEGANSDSTTPTQDSGPRTASALVGTSDNIRVGTATADSSLWWRLARLRGDNQVEPAGLAPSNVPPLANAGPDQAGVIPGDTVTLTGSASTDPDGTVTGWAWTQISGPPAVLSGTGPNRTYTAPLSSGSSTAVFGLVVTDNLGATSTQDTVSIQVSGTGTGGSPTTIAALTEDFTGGTGGEVETLPALPVALGTLSPRPTWVDQFQGRFGLAHNPAITAGSMAAFTPTRTIDFDTLPIFAGTGAAGTDFDRRWMGYFGNRVGHNGVGYTGTFRQPGDRLVMPGVYTSAENNDIPNCTNIEIVIGTTTAAGGIRNTHASAITGLMERHAVRILTGSSNIRIRAASQAYPFVFETIGAVGRTGLDQQGNTMLLLDPDVVDVQVQDGILRGSRAAGQFNYRASWAWFNRVTVEDTQADGFHCTNGSSYILFTDCISRRTGDDGVATVRYNGNLDPIQTSHHIAVVRHHVLQTGHGRGFANICCSDIWWSQIRAEGTAAAPFLVDREAGSATPYVGIYNHLAQRVHVKGGNWSEQDHGSLFFNNGTTTQEVHARVESVLIEDANPTRNVVRGVGGTGGVLDVHLKDAKAIGGSGNANWFGGNNLAGFVFDPAALRQDTVGVDTTKPTLVFLAPGPSATVTGTTVAGPVALQNTSEYRNTMLAFYAGDNRGGVQSVQVKVGDTVVATVLASALDIAGRRALSGINWAQFSNGPGVITLTATDASGANTGTVTRKITVSNASPGTISPMPTVSTGGGDPILLQPVTIFDSETGLGQASAFSTDSAGLAMLNAPGSADFRLYRADYAPVSTLWLSGYFTLSALPTTSTAILAVYSGIAKIADVRVLPTGAMQLRSINTDRWTSTPVAVGVRHRFALQASPTVGGTGTLRLRLYQNNSANGVVPTQDSGATVAAATVGTSDNIRVGALGLDSTLEWRLARLRGDSAVEPSGQAGANQPPVANAGPDQVNRRALSQVTVSGEGSTDDGVITGFTWTQVSGLPVTFVGTGTERTFLAPPSLTPHTVVLGLTVTDNGGLTSTQDTVSIGILPHSTWVRKPDGTLGGIRRRRYAP